MLYYFFGLLLHLLDFDDNFALFCANMFGRVGYWDAWTYARACMMQCTDGIPKIPMLNTPAFMLVSNNNIESGDDCDEKSLMTSS